MGEKNQTKKIVGLPLQVDVALLLALADTFPKLPSHLYWVGRMDFIERFQQLPAGIFWIGPTTPLPGLFPLRGVQGQSFSNRPETLSRQLEPLIRLPIDLLYRQADR